MATTCGGSGTCAPPTTMPCGAYARSGRPLPGSCVVESDCAQGFTCDATRCVPKSGSTYKDDHTLLDRGPYSLRSIRMLRRRLQSVHPPPRCTDRAAPAGSGLALSPISTALLRRENSISSGALPHPTRAKTSSIRTGVGEARRMARIASEWELPKPTTRGPLGVFLDVEHSLQPLELRPSLESGLSPGTRTLRNHDRHHREPAALPAKRRQDPLGPVVRQVAGVERAERRNSNRQAPSAPIIHREFQSSAWHLGALAVVLLV